jgi:uncharacterized protein with FMN-binding domain
MKKIVWGILATITGVVLLFSYRTSLDAVAPVAASGGTTGGTSTTGGDGGSDSSSGDDSTGSSSSSSSSSPSASSSGLKDGTFTGQSADTPYGPVQVKVTVSNGKLTRVQVPVYPTESFRDQEINQRAVPQLVSETLSAQSAGIQMVSGATFTSDGYEQSLQSALDQAKA